MYCVREVVGGDVGNGSAVAVKASVGSGVFVGGSWVKVGRGVAGSGGIEFEEPG